MVGELPFMLSVVEAFLEFFSRITLITIFSYRFFVSRFALSEFAYSHRPGEASLVCLRLRLLFPALK